MKDETELLPAVREHEPGALMSPEDLRSAMAFEAERIKLMREFVKLHMTAGVDFGVVPGTKTKPALFKPGAEVMCGIYHYAPEYDLHETFDPHAKKTWSRPKKEWDRREKKLKAIWKDGVQIMESGESIGYYEVNIVCHLRHTRSGVIMGEGVGSCNSWEPKYLTRDLYDMKNTILKMAKKRAHVDATLTACRMSAFFTQDIEDTIEESEAEPISEPAQAAPPPHSGTAAQTSATQTLRADMVGYCKGDAAAATKLMQQLGAFPDEKSVEWADYRKHYTECDGCDEKNLCEKGAALKAKVKMIAPTTWDKLSDKWASKIRPRFEALTAEHTAS